MPSDKEKAWDELNGKADFAYNREDYGEAEKLYAELLDQLPPGHPQHPLLTSYHAECLFRLGRFQESRKADHKIMHLALENPKIDHVDVFMEEVLERRYERGNASYQAGQYKAAINTYSFAMKVSKAVYGDKHQISRDLADALTIAKENLRIQEEEENRKKQEANPPKEKSQPAEAKGSTTAGAGRPTSSPSQATDPTSRRGGNSEEKKKGSSPAQGQDRTAQEPKNTSPSPNMHQAKTLKAPKTSEADKANNVVSSSPGRSSSKRSSAPVIHQPDVPKAPSSIPAESKPEKKKTETSPSGSIPFTFHITTIRHANIKQFPKTIYCLQRVRLLFLVNAEATA